MSSMKVKNVDGVAHTGSISSHQERNLTPYETETDFTVL
jgi:hypothetical protein